MSKNITLLLLCLIGYNTLFPQGLPNITRYKTTDEKKTALKNICDSLATTEHYAALNKIAHFALQQLPGDMNTVACFNYYLGSSCEGSLDRDSAIYYHEISLNAATKAGNSKRIRIALQRLLFLYHSAGNKGKSDWVAHKLQTILDSAKSDISRYEMLVFLGNYFNENAQYEKSIQYLTASLLIQKKLLHQKEIKDSSDIAITQLNIANTFLKVKQPGKAMEYIQASRPYAIGYEIALSFYYESIIEALLMLHETGNALVYYDSLYTKAQAGFASACGKNDVISTELAFAEHYLNRDQKDSALLFVNRTLQKSAQWSSMYQQAQVNYIAGKVYAALKEYKKALTYLHAAEPLCREANVETYASLMQSMARCYAATRQWQQAGFYYEKYIPLRDSLYNEAAKQSLANAEAKYQNKEKQQQIDTKNLQIKESQKQRLWLLAGLLLLSLVAILLMVIYRSKKRTADVLDGNNKKLAQLNNDLQEANQTKAKLFGIISHDLRSPISQVYQFLKLQQLDPHKLNEEQKNKLSNKIQTATGSLLETMEDLLLWSKTQMNQFNTEIQPVDVSDTVSECLQLLQLNSEAKNLKIENSIPPETIINSDPYFLQTILRNLLQNAIKASPTSGKIIIDFIDNKLSIKNHGGYFSQQQYEEVLTAKEAEKSLSGLGLRLVDELSKKIDTQVFFRDGNEDSTQVELIFG